jgi:hypothetical protein
MVALLSATVWCYGLVTDGASAATVTYSVAMTWTNPSPACVAPVVCTGVGTPAFSYGVPVPTSTAVSLTVATVASVTQVNSASVKAGTLTYCNGSVASDSVVNSVDLNATFKVVGGATGTVTPTTLLVNTPNGGTDPIADADVLSLSSSPGVEFHVLEDKCATIQLLTRFTPGAAPTLTVDLGPVDTPDSGYTTIDGARQVGIEVRPHEPTPHAINLTSNGLVQVLIPGSPLIDATTIDPASIVFEGAKPVSSKLVDLDRDGTTDLYFTVHTGSITTLEAGDTQACATFSTKAGVPLGGCDDVDVTRPSDKNKRA